MNKIRRILLSGLLSICLLMIPLSGNRALAAFNQPHYLVVPDYISEKVRIQRLYPRPLTITFGVPNCNPNSVAYHSGNLYVACNKDYGNGDRIEIYDLFGILGATGGTGKPDKIITSSEFNSIIAIDFDSDDNLWVSSYNNNQIIRFPKATLNSNNPTPDKKLIDSPDKPVGLAFDPQDGSLWIAGQYQGGIVLNIPKTELNKPGTTVNGIATIDASPSYCISNSAPGCQQKAGLFDNPEGITILNNDKLKRI